MFTTFGGQSIEQDMKRPRKHHKKRFNDPNNKICCPAGCGKELLNTQGLATHLLAIHRQSIDEYIPDPNASKANVYIPKPPDWKAPTPEEIAAQKAASFAAKKAAAMAAAGAGGDGSGDGKVKSKKRKAAHIESKSESGKDGGSSTATADAKAGGASTNNAPTAVAAAVDGEGDADDDSDDSDDDSDDDTPHDVNNLSDGGSRMFDKRKFNRGRAHRRSYSKDIKLQCIALREEGKSSEEVSRIMKISKSNIEKWCGEKVCKYYARVNPSIPALPLAP
jgi:hypothetical protein